MDPCERGAPAEGLVVRLPPFLPGVPSDYVLARLAKAGGGEVASGKFMNPDSSAALAVNCFGWFIQRADRFPPLMGLEAAGDAELVDIEFCARFPWSGGRHPWLDAVVRTPSFLIGVESKRFEPFRDKKSVSFSQAYDRLVWGDNMWGYERMRERLRSGDESFVHLDAAQLVKHAFGLVSQSKFSKRKLALFYLFAEPERRKNSPIMPDRLARHRQEIDHLRQAVAGDEVAFHAASYREWIATWEARDSEVAAHAKALIAAFAP